MVEIGISLHNADGRVRSAGKPTMLYETKILDDQGNAFPSRIVEKMHEKDIYGGACL